MDGNNRNSADSNFNRAAVGLLNGSQRNTFAQDTRESVYNQPYNQTFDQNANRDSFYSTNRQTANFA